MGFYFNKLMRCSESWSEVNGASEIRAIVTTRQAIEKEIDKRGRVIPSGERYVIYLKYQ
jgi:hypothetical protein